MAKFLLILFASSLSALSVQCHLRHDKAFNVLDFGATGDGSTDDTRAFEDAWESTCSVRDSSPTMHIPRGYIFLLQPVVFYGPCKSNLVKIVIDGTLVAPWDPSKWKCRGKKCHQWIGFSQLDGLYISGSGTINGQGAEWWRSRCKHEEKSCPTKPTGLVISNSNNLHINGLTFLDSPQMHIAIERSRWIHASALTIMAPRDSPNTDGIHTQHSQNVFINHAHIQTGDDCISIGDGSAHVHISRIKCGPGHGISIGSLGENGKYETVEHVHVSHVEFRNTSNGARIKTWQGGKGFARNIVFKQIKCYGVGQPIIIDQYYCDHERCRNQTSAVEVSNVRYSGIEGTSKEETAVRFACSESVPCKDILLSDVNLGSSQGQTETTSLCLNVQGRQRGDISPSVPCLSH
ncbi:probable polygalacturonase At1g80170 isoform X2 [Diospyros lotus]|uniref:probable polygalacturonase At1g80170 isoform X2 n=1 Tax=Diospyros lotus TaxID=55363 RepID=UPI002258889F|nr:probable polygalacturonase At1g80170 isoform X2 [Diospyros lotus]